jgi:methylamine---glutamate N-methyltransferase subunit A
MCGIVGLHLRDPELYPRLGVLLEGMLIQMSERGPDSAGVAVYTDRPDGPGTDLTVCKGVGSPAAIARECDLASRAGWQGLGHTRMATESAVTVEGCHPFSVGQNQCLVHNGSFSNHATIRRDLRAEGVSFDSENDSEVAARFVAKHLASGQHLEKALIALTQTFDGFYTLLVTSDEGFAVVRDPIACKPAVIAETPQWVAMASEYRALAVLPGIADAAIFEPEPERVYAWVR